ncbi:hypothetical protein Tco_0282186, partial [Tanacetum coccineum]
QENDELIAWAEEEAQSTYFQSPPRPKSKVLFDNQQIDQDEYDVRQFSSDVKKQKVDSNVVVLDDIVDENAVVSNDNFDENVVVSNDNTIIDNVYEEYFDVDACIVIENVILSNDNVVEEDFDVDDYIVIENVILSNDNVVEEDFDVDDYIVDENVFPWRLFLSKVKRVRRC